WQLAVPTHEVATVRVKASILRCGKCRQPRSAFLGSQVSQWLWDEESKYHLLKSSTWASSEKGWDQWISRDLFMSVRLVHLMKKIKAKGLDVVTYVKPKLPDKDDSAWIEDKLQLLQAKRVPLHAEGTLPEEDAKWLRGYIKGHSRKGGRTLDIKKV